MNTTRRRFLTKSIGFTLAVATSAALSPAFLSSKASASAPAKFPKTKENLATAFAGESQAYQRYIIFAEVADREGLPEVARLFRAISRAEHIHATSHLRNAGKIGNTMENLKTAIAGETYEYTQMYPTMTTEADGEGAAKEENYFRWAGTAEKGHATMYQKALDAQGKIPRTDYYICERCGYTHEGPNDGDCPVCDAPSKAFFKVDV